MSTNLPALPVKGLPTVEKHIRRLRYIDDDGKRVKYDSSSQLVPVADLTAIVAEIDAKQPPTEAKAIDMVDMLLGCYPTDKIHNPDVYTRALRTVFEEFPSDIGFKAIDELTKTSPFLPTRADVYKLCVVLNGARVDLKRAAQAQLAEHERRSKLPATTAKPGEKLVRDMDPEEREKFFADLRARHPEGFALASGVVGKGDEDEDERRGGGLAQAGGAGQDGGQNGGEEQ